jgi:hypothetical protein
MTTLLDRLLTWLAPYLIAAHHRESAQHAAALPPQWHPLPPAAPDDLALWRRVVEAIEARGIGV